MRLIKVGIIEDDPEIRMLLHRMIEKQMGFQVVSESADFTEAVTDFSKYRPDVVFMDIDLGGTSGLECAKVLTEWSPKLKVVFATAHSEYMANAFEIYAFDYLVKPFNMDRLTKTLARIKTMLEAEEAAGIVKNLEESQISQTVMYRDKLLIKGKDQVSLVDINDIIMIERSENATSIITREEHLQSSISLGDIEKKLNPELFMRCHKSYIINLSMITKIEPYGRWTYVVKLKSTEATALITAQNYETLKAMFG